MNLLRKYKISKLFNKPLTGSDCEIIELIKSKISDLIPYKNDTYPETVFYINSEGEWILKQDNHNKILWVNYHKLWIILEEKYLFENKEIQKLLKYFVEEEFKNKITTLGCSVVE